MSEIDKKKQQSETPPNSEPLEKIDLKALAEEEENKLLFGRHLTNQMKYVDYDRNDFKRLDSFVFNWATNGVDLLSKFLPLTTRLVSEQINLALHMTKKRFASEQELDTTDFRHTIVYYLKFIHGIQDETFKYVPMINIFNILEKTFIKNLVC